MSAKSLIEKAIEASQNDQLPIMRECLWEVVKNPAVSTDAIGDAIAVASGSDDPGLAVELLDYVETVLETQNPSDFSRSELTSRCSRSLADGTFQGVGITERRRIYWPLYKLDTLKVSESGIEIKRSWVFLRDETIFMKWSEVDSITLMTYMGWGYRVWTKLRTCLISSKGKQISIDVSTGRPDIENPSGFISAIKKHFPGLKTA